MTMVSLPDVPEGLEDKRDQAIAAIVIREKCSIQEAATKLAKIMAAADRHIKKALNAHS
jgi:hypothetical protein